MAFYQQQEIPNLAPIVTLERAKEHLKIEPDFDLEDGLIEGYVDASVSYVESYLGYAVQKQQYIVKGESFVDVLTFKQQKVFQVDEIKYKDENGGLQTLSDENYNLKTVDKFENAVIYTATELPKVQENKLDAVQMTVTLGLSKIPKAIIQAVLLLVGEFYEFRSNRPVKSVDAVTNLLSSYRKPC